MECPKCNYINAELAEDKWVEGDKGNFYLLPIEMKRNGHSWTSCTADLFGCPKCGSVFIEV